MMTAVTVLMRIANFTRRMKTAAIANPELYMRYPASPMRIRAAMAPKQKQRPSPPNVAQPGPQPPSARLVTSGHCWSCLVTSGHVWSHYVPSCHIWSDVTRFRSRRHAIDQRSRRLRVPRASPCVPSLRAVTRASPLRRPAMGAPRLD